MKLFNLVLGLALFAASCSSPEKEPNKPNVVIIYVDDLGYGDVGCYGATAVKTPNVDKLAEGGLQFLDGHCTSATCTPSRFSMLTGSYAFRNKASVLEGDAPLLIRPGTPTLASMLKEAGYETAVVGKWHLGLGNGNVDWNTGVKPGPLEIGFDYSFLIPATGDRVPCVYVENHQVVNLDPNDPITVSYKNKVGDWPTGTENPELLRQPADPQHSNTIVNGLSRIGYMTGGEKALWVDEKTPEILAKKATSFIEKNKEKPFFLFFSYHDIHVPRVANKKFDGATDMGVRGDVIAQMDWSTGQVIDKLEELGLDKNTLVIFTSDNGPVLNDGYDDESVERLGDHKPAGPFRGGKYSAFEAGTRVPFISYWPGVIKPGKSEALVNQVDLFASLSKMVGRPLKSKDAPDSFDYLDALFGKTTEGRDLMLEESYTLSLRQNNFKYTKPIKGKFTWIKNKGIESGFSEDEQLYDLANDHGEQKNIAPDKPEKVKEMSNILKEIVDRGSSRPGYGNE